MSHIRLGEYNLLEVVKEVDFGVYLSGFTLMVAKMEKYCCLHVMYLRDASLVTY